MSKTWSAYKGGETIGSTGSEEGTIIQEETYDGAARIALERDARRIPFAITAGIGGWFVDTHYFSTEEDARTAYAKMKCDLVSILGLIEAVDWDNWTQDEMHRISQEFQAFYERYP